MSVGPLLIYAKPARSTALVLSWALFAVGIAAYLYVAQARHRENPEERVTPSLAQMAAGMLTSSTLKSAALGSVRIASGLNRVRISN